jgi:MFS family permease
MALAKLKLPKIFFGWWIVFAAFLVTVYLAGGIILGFTAIFEPIANEMQWSYTQISFASSLRGLEASVLAPLVGIFVDRWGPRRLVFTGAFLLAGGCFVLSNATSIAMFYVSWVIIATGASCCAVTVVMTAIANWFRKKMGIATGIVAAGVGFGGLIIPVMVTLIDLYGWRNTMLFYAIGTLVLFIPLSLLFRHKPEQYGYLPDGEIREGPGRVEGAVPLETVEVYIESREALRSNVFWQLAIGFLLHLGMTSALTTHIMPYLSTIGIDRIKASLVATAYPLISIAGRIGFGWLGDRFGRKPMILIGYIMMGIGFLCFAYTFKGGTWLLVPFLIFFSIGYGGSMALRPALVRDYFGRTKFGSIFGLIIGIAMVGAIVGAPLAGWIYDSRGSYQVMWFICVGVSVAVFLLISTTSPLIEKSIMVKQSNP